jgi:hypothetical protein
LWWWQWWTIFCAWFYHIVQYAPNDVKNFRFMVTALVCSMCSYRTVTSFKTAEFLLKVKERKCPSNTQTKWSTLDAKSSEGVFMDIYYICSYVKLFSQHGSGTKVATYIQGATLKFLDNCYKAQLTSYMDIIYFYSSIHTPPWSIHLFTRCFIFFMPSRKAFLKCC